MLKRIRNVTTDTASARDQLFANLAAFSEPLKRSHRVRELHESNRVEGLGPELIAHTHEILSSKDASDIERELTRYTITKSVESDPRTLDVLQLSGAKNFADTIMYGNDRPITEIDIRGMHKTLMGPRHPLAGRYKVWCNEISGAAHTPFAPTDTPSAMGQLVEWLGHVRKNSLLPPVIIAATVHAWLAHVHPFDDGNGRVARLLANIVVGSAGLPPLIIRVSGDRSRYINALAVSDEGGDLAPLIGVFLRVLERAIGDMRNPRWALRIFEEEIKQRAASSYVQWKSSFVSWLELLGGHLALHGLEIRTDPEEMVDQVAYARIRNGTREGLVVGGIGSQERYPGSRVYLLLDPAGELFRHSEGEPALSFLIYSRRPWSTTVYEKMFGTIVELIVREGRGDSVVIRTKSGRTLSIAPDEAAEFVASALARDFQDGIAKAHVLEPPLNRYPWRRSINGI